MRFSLRSRFIIGAVISAWAALFLIWGQRGFNLSWVQEFLLVTLAAWFVGVLIAKGPVHLLERLQRRIQRLLAGDLRPQQPIDADDPGLQSLAASINDIAAFARSIREEADRRVSESQSILDDLSDAVIAVDDTGRVTRVNPAAGLFFGQLPAQDMLGHTILECTLNHQLDRMVRECLQEQSAKEDFLDIPIPKKRSVSVAVIPRIDSSGGMQGAVIVVHDISDIRRVDRLQKEFVANASHELRTPIAGIQVMADSLLGGANEDPELRDRFVKSISDSAERLSRLVDDLLFLNIQESGSKPELEDVPVNEIAASVVEKLMPQAQMRKVALEFQPGKVINIRADHQDIWRAVANLVDNALRYTNAEGTVVVSTQVVGSEVYISVADTGIGIASDQQERIFERFYRVDVARSRESGGTGLGLSIVRQIVEASGGHVTLVSAIGQGSTFTIILPSAVNAEAS